MGAYFKIQDLARRVLGSAGLVSDEYVLSDSRKARALVGVGMGGCSGYNPYRLGGAKVGGIDRDLACCGSTE